MITHRAPISGIAAHRDQYVLTAGYDNQVILWDAKTQRPLARAMHDHLANQGAFSPDGAYVVTSSSDYSARLWTVPDLRLVAVFADQEDDVEMSVFHPDKPLVATASRDHRVRVYDFGGKLLHTFSGHTADVISVEWMRGADEIVSSSDDGPIKRWSLANNGLVADIDLDGIETDTIAIAADGRIFAGNDEGEIGSIGGDGARATIAAHDAKCERAEAHPAAAALDEFGGAGRQQRQELRAGAVDLHIDVRFVEAEHPREHVELDPAARRRVVARLRIGEARARERHEAVVMRARAEIDRAAARVQRRRHGLLVAAHREIDALRQRRDLRRARQRGRHAAMREHQLPREFAADHRVAVMQHARGRRVVAEPVALRGAADGERGARQRVRAIERDRPRGRAQRPEHVDGLAQFARAPANRAGAAELDQIAVAQHHAFAFADESPGHERAVAAVIVQFPPPRRPADARVDARHVRIGDDRVATLRIATQYVARAQQAGFPGKTIFQ